MKKNIHLMRKCIYKKHINKSNYLYNNENNNENNK